MRSKDSFLIFVASCFLIFFAIPMFFWRYKQLHLKPKGVQITEQDRPITLSNTEELAYIISAECLQCDSLEKVAVGSVVLNRVKTDGFPETIKDVISANKAFQGYCAEQYMFDQQCYNIATLLIGGVNRDTSILFFYKKELMKPKWVKKVLFVKKYHKFGI